MALHVPRLPPCHTPRDCVCVRVWRGYARHHSTPRPPPRGSNANNTAATITATARAHTHTHTCARARARTNNGCNHPAVSGGAALAGKCAPFCGVPVEVAGQPHTSSATALARLAAPNTQSSSQTTAHHALRLQRGAAPHRPERRRRVCVPQQTWGGLAANGPAPLWRGKAGRGPQLSRV